MVQKYQTLKEFYPYYLTEHLNPTSRNLHFIGTTLFLGVLLYAILTFNWTLLWLCPVVGYGFAWVGHFFFEKNKPATFVYPAMSLVSDFIMYWHFLTGQLPAKMAEAKAQFGVN
jgi:hypothetical protein